MGKCFQCGQHVTARIAGRENFSRLFGRQIKKYICDKCTVQNLKIEQEIHEKEFLLQMAEEERRKIILSHAESKIRVIQKKENLYQHRVLRRARENNASGEHSIEYIEYLHRKQNGKCVACSTDISTGYHVDHIYALARGGSNDKSNIQLLCRTCNSSKGAKDPIEFLQKNGLKTYCDI